MPALRLCVHAAGLSCRLLNAHPFAECLCCDLQLALILPYVRVGEWITGSPRVELKPVGITDLFKQGSGGKLSITPTSDPLPDMQLVSRALYWQLQIRHHCLPKVSLNHEMRAADLLRSVGCALLAWALTWPLVAGGVYLATVPGFQILRRKYAPCNLASTVELPQCLLPICRPDCLLSRCHVVPRCTTAIGRNATITAPADASPVATQVILNHDCRCIYLVDIRTVRHSAQNSQ